jgi:uncharacterized phage infection (PIP) family protein YhgE
MGLGLVLVAAASLLLTGYCLLQTWRLQGKVTASLQSGLDVISNTLSSSSDGLTTISQSLQSTSDSLVTLQDAVLSAGSSAHNQAASLQSLSTLFSKDLPDAMTGAQTAMIGAQVGAKEVEDTLTVLTSNPAFSATPFNPPVPLSTALSGVASGLGALPAPMKTAGSNLATVSSDTTTLEDSFKDFAASLEKLRAKLDESRSVLERYQQQLDKLENRLSWLRAEIPKWVRIVKYALSFLLGWLGAVQFYALMRGWNLMMRG